MLTEVLDAALGKKYITSGFSLSEDEHIVELMYMGKVVDRYNSSRVTIEVIRNRCEELIKENMDLWK